jgi:nucleoside-diphosphate-sugar epimerase
MPSTTVYGVTRHIKQPFVEEDSYNPVVLDMNDPGWISLLPDSVDVVIHLAQSRHYRDFPEKADDIFQVNTGATLELLEWARKKRVKKFIFASTGNVYQKSSEFQKETSPCLPDSMYATSKLSAENMVRQYSSYFQIAIMRIFSVYGPNQKNMLVANILQNIKDGAEISLADGIGLYLTPVYISDVVEMIKRLVVHNEKSNPAIYNLSGPEVVTLADIVRIISDGLGIHPKIKVTEEEPVFLQGDGKKLCDAIHYKQNVMIKEGLRNIVKAKTC